MVVHVFTAERYHLVPRLAKGYVTTYRNKAQHRILLVGSANTNKVIYDKLFKEAEFSDYHFVTTKWQLYRLLRRNRNHSILFHAGSYSYFLIAFAAGCHHVNWVCWGAGASIRNNWKSKATASLKSWVYRRFESIVTLMNDDRESIIRDFRVKPDRIKTIPYASAGEKNPRSEICQRLLNVGGKQPADKPLVFLGNNPSNMGYYVKLMDLLYPFRGKIRVQCMMNYSVNRNQAYNDFINHGQEVFGDDFRSNEEFHEGLENYINYMNTCDIYICGFPDQSGLGALNTVLELGKKVYVTGKNYTWATKECGAIVFNVNEISDYDEFVKPLSDKEIEHNVQVIKSRRALPPKQWREYLHKINNLS